MKREMPSYERFSKLTLMCGVVKNYGPFWVPIIVRHLIFGVTQQGTIILTTTLIEGQIVKSEHHNPCAIAFDP